MQTTNYPVSRDYQVSRSESMNEPEVGSIMSYYINLDERGDFYADVRNAYEKSVFEISGFEIFEDGFMANKHDMEGLKDYLVSLGIMQPSQQLLEA
ncbi:hypothetical protein [Pseudomonas sp. GOM6]|uniref:hypothetical protein n=1 Tax=Pseudomonas sp. GOM6 TaxID=3036944 RepID=UPI00240A65D7|nr:hypothetical protein [Pseudomonas sp. GOM6]MDG1580819.1 hypothetical protein [Pseudomonas sp. GOM6]